MPTTTQAFASISLTDLGTVTGGCGKKCCPPPQAPPPQAAAAPAPDQGPLVSTNVSITGYGQPQQASA